MKKTVVGVILIVVVVAVGAPFANGLIMERVVRQTHVDINKMYADSGSDISIEIMEYDRGFSSSRIKWKLSLGKLESLYGVDGIMVVEDAKHGYTSVVSKSSLDENKWYRDFVERQLDGKDPVRITTRYAMSGNIESTLSLDEFSIKDGQDLLKSRPGKIVIACGKGLKRFTTHGSYGGFSIDNKLNISDISMQSELEKISTYIWAGNGSVTVDNSEAVAKNDHMKLSNMSFGYKMDYEKKSRTLSMGADYGAENITFGEDSIENASVHISISGVDADGYENLMTVYTGMINTAMEDAGQTPDDSQDVEALMQQQMMSSGIQLVTALEKLLKDGLELKITDLKATLPSGDINGDVVLGLKKDMTMVQFMPIATNPKLALDIFSLRSDISLPAEMAGENPRLFLPLFPGMRTGIFEKAGDRVVHKAETIDGKLMLNGQEVLLD